MKRSIIPLVVLIPVLVLAAQDHWLAPISPAALAATPAEDIPESDFFEVAASKEGTAEYWLKDKVVMSQTKVDIRFFGQRNFQCEAPKQLYLIRAAYENGGTGKFMLKRYGIALLVAHGSLGPASGVQRSALIVCLGFQPTEVFSAILGAL